MVWYDLGATRSCVRLPICCKVQYNLSALPTLFIITNGKKGHSGPQFLKTRLHIKIYDEPFSTLFRSIFTAECPTADLTKNTFRQSARIILYLFTVHKTIFKILIVFHHCYSYQKHYPITSSFVKHSNSPYLYIIITKRAIKSF